MVGCTVFNAFSVVPVLILGGSTGNIHIGDVFDIFYTEMASYCCGTIP